MQERASVPAIRFAGFADDWKQRMVQELAERFDNLRIPVAANLRKAGSTPYYGANGIQDYVDGFTHEGEFILVAEDGASDLKNYPVQYVSGRIWVNNHAHVLQGKSGLADNHFLKFAISQADIESLLVGGSRAKLNAEILMAIILLVPSKPEQHIIGEFLDYLDSLITLYQHKYTQLCNIKKSMLEKMFPKGGADLPEIRFAGFTGTWEQRKIGDFIRVLSASRVHKDEWQTDGVPFYRSSDVVSAFKGSDNEKAFISMELYEELVKSSGKLEKGDILITGGGSIGIPYIVPNDKPLYSKDADLIWVKKSSEHNSEYLYAYFTSQSFRAYISGISHVGTIAHYTIEQVKDTPVQLPTMAEQRAIGAFFSNLDNLIALHQRKLERLQNIKKACMERMFV